MEGDFRCLVIGGEALEEPIEAVPAADIRDAEEVEMAGVCR